ncbi:MAG: hypothetical protein WD894_19330 [Pirellulales bacterium]
MAIAFAWAMWQAVLAPANEDQIVDADAVSVTVPRLVRNHGSPVSWDAEKLRKRFGFASLAERLAYEDKRGNGNSVRVIAHAQPLSEAAKKALDTMEASIESQRRFDLRTRALQALHSDRVEQFISREGFGLARLPTPTPNHLELPESPPIQFASVSSEALEQDGARLMPIPSTLPDRGEAPSRLPSLSMLRVFHLGGSSGFLSVSGWGVVKDKEHVAGFGGHAFSYLPTLVEPRASKEDRRPAEPDPKHPWQVTRLELVSLLKHDKPVVYVSDHLPRMTELNQTRIRELSDFERKALQTLQSGDELAAEATLNRIHMLGAVRATRQCLDCHTAERGGLLGAFSYELRRDPPVKPISKPAA